MAKKFSSREFDQDTSGAKRAAAEGPVFITDRGEPAYVLLSIKDYRSLACQAESVVELLAAQPGTEDVEIETPEARDLGRAADLS
jgi:prevent-host-death family protein